MQHQPINTLRQIWALAHKTLLIVVVRHWLATLFRAVLLPIVFMVFLVSVKYFAASSNGYGIGSPAPVASLQDVLPTSLKLVFVQPSGLGPDVSHVVDEVIRSLQDQKQVIFLTNETDLPLTCVEGMTGSSDCFAAVVFNDSPLTVGKKATWNYTIRTDSNIDGNRFQVTRHDNNQERVFLPLQVAIDNSITNSTDMPEEYMYTTISQAQHDENKRKEYLQFITNVFGIMFFVAFSFQMYHLVGIITTERASGIAGLIDAMGGTPAIRITSYLVSFNIIYAPSWIVFGLLIWNQIFSTSSVLISLSWQILTGLALTSASVFAAMFFTVPQISSICCTLGFITLAILGLLVNRGTSPAGITEVLSFLFPSMNFMFVMGYIARYEQQGQPTNLLHAPEPISQHPGGTSAPGILLWVFLILQIVIYPVMAAYTERWIHGAASNNGRTKAQLEPGSAVEASNLSKIYPPTRYQRYCARTKPKAVEAVSDLTLVARRGQITCLLGANGSGKTTTLEMIAGFRTPTSGSIYVDAGRGQLGICPQRNVLWDELTVQEHVVIWNAIKQSCESADTLENIIDGCGLMPKRNAKAGMLSGGQKRKLQLACMLVGSTVCLLDEVSSGLDPLSRRSIWNILLAERSRRTMIMSTHYLDEVDILADHVVMISRGRLRSEGSTVELKEQCAKGYRLLIEDRRTDTLGTEAIGRRAEAQVLEVSDAAAAAHLLTSLESKGDVEVSIAGPTIEDVFMNLCDESQAVQKEKLIISTVDGPANNTHDTTPTATAAPELELSSGDRPSFWSQTRTLFWKRITILRRNWWPYLIAIGIPLITTPVLHGIIFYYKTPLCNSSIPITENSLQYVNIHTAAMQIGQLQVHVGPPSANDSLYNIVSRFSIGSGLNLQDYSKQFILAENLADLQDLIVKNYSTVAPGALYIGDSFRAPTYAFPGDFGNLPAMSMQNLWAQMKGGIEISVSYAPFTTYMPPSAGTSLVYTAFFALAQAVYPTLFSLYPTYEKHRKVRAQQYSNGVRSMPLWVSYAMFDFTFVLLISAICTAIVAVEIPTWIGVGYLFPVLFLYGLAATLFSYVISIISGSQLAAIGIAAGVQSAMVLLMLLAFMINHFFASALTLKSNMDTITYALDLVFPVGNVIRAILVGLNVYEGSCRNGVIVSYGGSFYAYGGPIFYLCIQIFFLFGLLRWLDQVHPHPRPRQRQEHEDPSQTTLSARNEVENEKTRTLASDSDLVRVLNVTKTFGSTVAVHNVTLGIQKGEILVLLGPNGGGKTTLFDMIRACPQFDALDEFMTTVEHLVFYARIKGVPDVDRNVQVVLDQTGLRGYEHSLSSKLSGGNQRKLSLAIALLGDPPVLILDEPSSSMDAVSKRLMWKTLHKIAAGRSMLLTTHSMEEAEALATRVAILSNNLLSVGTTRFLRRLYGNYYHIHIMLKSAPTSTNEEILAVERWVKGAFAGARLNPFGNYYGQIRFSVPSSFGRSVGQEYCPSKFEFDYSDGHDEIQKASTERVGFTNTSSTLFTVLQDNIERLGIAHYSIEATTLEDVFINILTENNGTRQQC